jgi:hypothetical protein
VDVLSDDRIILRENAVRGESGQVVMYGTPWHGEAAFASPASAPLARILILEHGRGNTLKIGRASCREIVLSCV